MAMIHSYLKIALRNLFKQRVYTLINILGLTVGMASCLLLFFWVQDEMSYDRHHTKLDRLYRVSTEFNGNNKSRIVRRAPYPFAPTVKEEYPEVEESLRIHHVGSISLGSGDKTFKVEDVILADAGLFDLFTIPLLEGNPETALTEVNSIVIDETTARNIFGQADPIGKLLTEGSSSLKVTAVFEDMPENSHFKAHAFIPISLSPLSKIPDWVYEFAPTYLLLRKGADPSFLEGKFPEMVKKHIQPVRGQTADEITRALETTRFSLDPVREIHLYAEGKITYVYIFSALGVIILLIAGVNYMNLATARSAKRAKEVGLRKVMGAYRSQLLQQFLSESFLLSLLALTLAIGLVEISLPAFNQLAAKSIETHYWGNWPFLFMIFSILLLIGLLSGSYPAFYLSAFKPVKVLKGGVSSGIKNSKIRSSLVVIQFSVSIFLVVATIVIYKQLHFVRNTDLGYNKEHLLILDGTQVLGKQAETFKQEVLSHPAFKAGTVSAFLPISNSRSSQANFWPEGPQENIGMYRYYVDADYLKTLGMQMKEGRFFSDDFPSDSTAVVINETAAKQLGYEQTLGKMLHTNGEGYSSKIIGVVKDFNFHSLKNKIRPLVFYLYPINGKITFRIEGSQNQEALAFLEEKWNQMAPGQPFSYSFLDDRFNQMYKSEEQSGEILATFSALAIFIACLGLFGLVAFTAEQRRKEIGIRKVLGASIQGIIMLQSKDFGRLLLIAFVLASPLAWWVMNNWLQNFQFKTSIGLDVFVLAGLFSFVVAWLTMSFHAIKAATDDPVKALRYE